MTLSPATPDAATPDSAAADAPCMDIVNMPALLDRVGNDRDFLHELFHIFEVEFPRLQSALGDAVSAGDLYLAATTAHRLKGMLTNLSIEKAAAAAGVVETMAAAVDQRETEAALADFNHEVVHLLPRLEACLAQPNSEKSGL